MSASPPASPAQIAAPAKIVCNSVITAEVVARVYAGHEVGCEGHSTSAEPIWASAR